jgi:uridine kinase
LENIDIMHLIAMIYLGNTASQAIELLIKKGVPESRIIFLNLVSVSYSIEY